MDKIVAILKAILQIIPLIKKLFPEADKKLPKSLNMTDSVWDKKDSNKT